MSERKKVLLIAGGGTLGTYTARELLEKGHSVDVICLEDKVSCHPNLTFIKADADLKFLESYLEGKHYDGIVNFLHYTTLESYKPFHPLLTAHTDQLIFLSSYRIYANEQHPITESAPRLLDLYKDEEYQQNETYALPKARCEDYLRQETDNSKWTIVRPVISFSANRFDLVMGGWPIGCALNREPLYLPEMCRNLVAGLDWAGNSGKLIASLLFKEAALGEAFTISSAQGLTWGDVADIYTELLGLEVKWVDMETYLDKYPFIKAENNKQVNWQFIYDRAWSRDIDNSKVLAVTGLKKEDFTPIREGLRTELLIYQERRQHQK